jgi:decaprenylphospho-beta-D-ribofuranose 2-oxidase
VLANRNFLDNSMTDTTSKESSSRLRTFTSWGRAHSTKAPYIEPSSRDELQEQFNNIQTQRILAYGAGRSYGDQAISKDGTAVMTHRLKSVISFDPDNAELVVESGATFAELLATLVPRGLMLPVNPGTGFVTIGGAIANDIHGKNHDVDGSFCNHVKWIELLTADGNRHVVSREKEADLFYATIGGSGMTGIILSAAIRLMRVSGDCVRMTQSRMTSLDMFFEELLVARENKRFFVGWIDALCKGKNFGRGILESAEFKNEFRGLKPGRRVRVPIDFPSATLNAWSVRAFNALYYHHVPASGRVSEIPVDKFLYPLDAIVDWNRLYGRLGFDQFQCVIPDDGATEGLRQILGRISQSGIGSFLGVIKTLGGTGEGHLSFPIRGVTLALDIPRKKGSTDLMLELQRMTADFGGRIYLAKDSRMTSSLFERMYPNLPKFREALNHWDPDHRFDSVMSRRLSFRTAA